MNIPYQEIILINIVKSFGDTCKFTSIDISARCNYQTYRICRFMAVAISSVTPSWSGKHGTCSPSTPAAISTSITLDINLSPWRRMTTKLVICKVRPLWRLGKILNTKMINIDHSSCWASLCACKSLTLINYPMTSQVADRRPVVQAEVTRVRAAAVQVLVMSACRTAPCTSPLVTAGLAATALHLVSGWPFILHQFFCFYRFKQLQHVRYFDCTCIVD